MYGLFCRVNPRPESKSVDEGRGFYSKQQGRIAIVLILQFTTMVMLEGDV